jgi:hypothetical protein
MFALYLHTNFPMSNSNGALVIAIQPKLNYIFTTTDGDSVLKTPGGKDMFLFSITISCLWNEYQLFFPRGYVDRNVKLGLFA